jgi:hypothetical protein
MADQIWPPLQLLTRQGCCLCEGLRERLEALVPAPPLHCIDVDADAQLQARFGLEVPVLMTASGEVLSRVPPRLSGDRLADWLQRNLNKTNPA